MRPPVEIAEIFRETFSLLRAQGYQWKPAKPERLLEMRKSEEAYPTLQRVFGLGSLAGREAEAALLSEGFPADLARQIAEIAPAISRREEIFVPHSHWPAKPGADYVYLGEESFELLRLMGPHLEKFEKASVLDLGSGSGALSFEIASRVKKVLGFDVSRKAVEWSRAAASAQGFENLVFHAAAVGSPDAEALARGDGWDFAILNPPFAVPTPSDPRPHRDGGRWGIELPLLFLRSAARQLKVGGEVFSLITNPIVQGRSAFFDQLDKKAWDVIEKKCLHDQFNHSLYRKERYLEQGIQRVELHFLHLMKKRI